MYRFFLVLVDIIPAAVVLVPLFSVLYGTAYSRDLKKSILYCLFSLYLASIFSLVGIPNVTYFRPEVNMNLIPFLGMMEDLKNCILNLALFVPLGVFLPVLWQRFRGIVPSAVFGLSLSLAIELLQMLTFRTTDVNDLITNTVGTVVGFLLAKPLTDRYFPVGKRDLDVWILILLSFGVMFFLHPFLSPLIWDRIL